MSYGDGEAMPTGREKPGEHRNARIIREQNEIRNAAPAGDGGLREALEAAIDRADPPGRMKAGTPSVSVAQLRSLLAAAPAVPQPVDREALAKAISAASNPEGTYVTPGRMYVENWADVFADAVLAVLAGEQEQR